MENDMIEPSPELLSSLANFYMQSASIPPYERILRERAERRERPGFDSEQHFRDVIYLLNLLDRERR